MWCSCCPCGFLPAAAHTQTCSATATCFTSCPAFPQQMCKAIPKGKVSTYGDMAKALSSSARAVGQVGWVCRVQHAEHVTKVTRLVLGCPFLVRTVCLMRMCCLERPIRSALLAPGRSTAVEADVRARPGALPIFTAEAAYGSCSCASMAHAAALVRSKPEQAQPAQDLAARQQDCG